MDETKLKKLLAVLEDVRLLLQRAQLTCEQAHRELQIKISENWEIIEKD
jgi:hypothetical protein